MFGDDGYGEPRPGTGIPGLTRTARKEPVRNFEESCDEFSPYGMLNRIRQSLQARLEGRNEGGDTEVMRLVDEIVKKEWPNGEQAALQKATNIKEANEEWLRERGR